MIFDDNGVLRFIDNSGDVSYRLGKSGERIIIDSQYYLVTEMEDHYKIIGIDEKCSQNYEDITLIPR